MSTDFYPAATAEVIVCSPLPAGFTASDVVRELNRSCQNPSQTMPPSFGTGRATGANRPFMGKRSCAAVFYSV